MLTAVSQIIHTSVVRTSTFFSSPAAHSSHAQPDIELGELFHGANAEPDSSLRLDTSTHAQVRQVSRAGSCENLARLVLFPPIAGACAILHNLIGSKVLGSQHQGFDFFGGSAQVNYLLAGMALSPAHLALDAHRRHVITTSGRDLLITERFIFLAVSVGLAASVGALAAAIAAARHEASQTPDHSAAANATAAAIVGGAHLLFDSWQARRRAAMQNQPV